MSANHNSQIYGFRREVVVRQSTACIWTNDYFSSIIQMEKITLDWKLNEKKSALDMHCVLNACTSVVYGGRFDRVMSNASDWFKRTNCDVLSICVKINSMTSNLFYEFWSIYHPNHMIFHIFSSSDYIIYNWSVLPMDFTLNVSIFHEMCQQKSPIAKFNSKFREFQPIVFVIQFWHCLQTLQLVATILDTTCVKTHIIVLSFSLTASSLTHPQQNTTFQ